MPGHDTGPGASLPGGFSQPAWQQASAQQTDKHEGPTRLAERFQGKGEVEQHALSDSNQSTDDRMGAEKLIIPNVPGSPTS